MHQHGALEDLIDLRSSMVRGYDPDDVNRTFGRLEDATGIRLVCVWELYDSIGFGGNSDFYLESSGELHYLAGDLWQWLNGSPDDPDTPAWPGPPETWTGALARLPAAAHDDGFHNLSLYDKS